MSLFLCHLNVYKTHPPQTETKLTDTWGGSHEARVVSLEATWGTRGQASFSQNYKARSWPLTTPKAVTKMSWGRESSVPRGSEHRYTTSSTAPAPNFALWKQLSLTAELWPQEGTWIRFRCQGYSQWEGLWQLIRRSHGHSSCLTPRDVFLCLVILWP